MKKRKIAAGLVLALSIILMTPFSEAVGVNASIETKAASKTKEEPVATETPAPTHDPNADIDYKDVLKINQDEMTLAVGSTGQLSIVGIEQVESYTIIWSSEDKSVVTVEKDGTVKAVSKSSDNGVLVKCVVAIKGRNYEFGCMVYVSNPVLQTENLYVNVSGKCQVQLTGLVEKSKVTYDTSDPMVAIVSETGEVLAFTTGRTIITIRVDGKELTCTVLVTNAALSSYWYITYRGQSKTLKITGNSKTTAITFKSENPKVCTVNSKGKVKAVGRGNTRIAVSVDGATLYCVVNVTYKKAFNVIKKGKTKLGYVYSQARRTSAKYFDCSSFVWRMYKTQKIYFGSKYACPVAASEARYMVQKKKAIAYKYVKESKLLAGDVLFIKGKHNGRYKNICHTAIYIGNGTILHSTPPCVKYGTYDQYKTRIAVIARPCK